MLGFKNFLLDEDGAGVVEMILIIVVLIGLVLIFKKQLTAYEAISFRQSRERLVKCERQYNDICPRCLSCWCHSFCFTVKPAESDTYQYSRHEFRAVAESVFAQYCRPLWDEYHLLAYDAGSDAMGNVDIENVKSYMKKLTTDNFKIGDSGTFAGGTSVNGTSMLRLSMDEPESMKYVLMTDDGGDVYTNAVVSYMKKNIGYETVKNLYSQYSSLNENKSAGEYDDSKIDSALKALKDNAAHEGGGKSIARSSPRRAYSAPSSVSKSKQTSESKAESTEGGNAIENPLVKVQKVKASGILSQVVDESTVSGNSIDTSARVSGRSLHKGTGGWSKSSDDWYAKVLMQQYILTYMSCYTDTNPNHALNYEVEYIIGGRASDKDNLKIVIAEIMALRTAANMAYLSGSASKQAQAMALATIIGGITLQPEIIEGVEKGILAAWAFCESVLDLRALLDGDKIPLIKSDKSWTSSLYGMTSMLTSQVEAKLKMKE